MLDIRTPIGFMFLVLGVLIGAYGLVTPSEVYRVSLGLNVNLGWGGCMALFGLVMLIWQRLSPHQPHEAKAEPAMSATPEAESTLR